jgi:hypothetical protein
MWGGQIKPHTLTSFPTDYHNRRTAQWLVSVSVRLDPGAG